MKKIITLLLIIVFVSASVHLQAQCSICTKTAMQLGDKPAQGLNAGILYLMAVPYLAIGVVGYKWYKSQSSSEEKE